MTSCLGWKTESCAFLVADTATTSLRPLGRLRSSFGEQHESGNRGNTEERAIKIVSAHRAGITFSGNVTLGYAVVDTFRMAVAAGVAPNSALQAAVASNVTGDQFDLCMLCAYVENGQAKLISFNRDRDQSFLDHGPGDLVQLGSLVAEEGTVVCQISDAFLGGVSKMELDGSALLACALALCQSYGVHNALLTRGVGGAFVGALVDASGFHWQPDIGYLLSNWDKGTAIGKGDGVFPFVRDDVLVVRSLLADGPPRVFITSLGEPLESALERAKEVDRQCLTTLRALQFDYLALLNTSIPVIAVVEMGRRSEHRDIMLHSLLPPSVDGRAHGPMSISSRLHASISGIWADGEKPDPEAILGAQLYYINYQHPYFDIRHTNIDVDFFGNEGERIELPGDVIAAYKAARDTAPIFIQHRDNVAFGAVHFLKWHLDSQGKTLEDYIPARERRADGNMFTLTFPIHFTEGSFYMNTRRGPRDLRELKPFVEITWRGVDNSRPRMDDLSWLSGLSTLED